MNRTDRRLIHRRAGAVTAGGLDDAGRGGAGNRPPNRVLGVRLLAVLLACAAEVASLSAQSAAGAPSAAEGTPKGASLEERAPVDPVAFFRKHFFPFEPFYFIAGTESPNAKFQVSLRYQLFTEDGWLAEQWHGLTNFSVAYTQTSLWDWNHPSAPFLDTSYKPELNYTWLRVDRGRWADWLRLDLQGGAQHESNGRGGDESRSLNLVYLRPTVTLGLPGRFQATVAPKVFLYVGDLSDNPEIAEYRGYVELRTTLGWSGNVQLAATARVGDDFDRGSLQLDLTYPLWKLPILRSGVFLQAQYFTGYGESLLLYNERSDGFRAGFALFR